MPNTVVTPHLGASTREAQDKAGVTVVGLDREDVERGATEVAVLQRLAERGLVDEFPRHRAVLTTRAPG